MPASEREALRRRATHEGMDLQSYLLQVTRRELSLLSETEWLEGLRAQPTAIGLPAAAKMPQTRP